MEWWEVKPKRGPALYFDHHDVANDWLDRSRGSSPIEVARDALGLGVLPARTGLHQLAGRPDGLIAIGRQARGRELYMKGFAK